MKRICAVLLLCVLFLTGCTEEPRQVCGDGNCDKDETKSTCPEDCDIIKPELNNTATVEDRVIILPPEKGMYIGQVEAFGGETATLEKALGRRAAIMYPIPGEDYESRKPVQPLMMGAEDPGEGRVDFNVAHANKLWDDGYVFSFGAYEMANGHFSVIGTSTVDKLLNGDFDDELHKIAMQAKEFGKPMFFTTTREPNGIMSLYMGGYGPNGDKHGGWAEQEYDKGNKKAGFDSFKPPAPPEGAPNLYDGLGDPEFCDGFERLVAAQRYYYDFFVRREGMNFLTFESMGLWVPIQLETGEEFNDKCFNYSLFFEKLDGYYDWVSINWYLIPNIGAGETQGQPTSVYIKTLENFMDIVRESAPGKPVMITEFGFGDDNDSQKVKDGLNALINDYPEISAFVLWFDMGIMGEEVGDQIINLSMNIQIEPGTPEGEAFREVVEANPDYFHSCVRFSDGTDCETFK